MLNTGARLVLIMCSSTGAHEDPGMPHLGNVLHIFNLCTAVSDGSLSQSFSALSLMLLRFFKFVSSTAVEEYKHPSLRIVSLKLIVLHL